MLKHTRSETLPMLTVKMVQFVVCWHACMGHQMFNAHVQCGIWYADDTAHIVLLGEIALVLVAGHVLTGLHPPALCPEHSRVRRV